MLNILLVSISRGGRLGTIAFGGGGRNIASITRGSCNAKNILVTSYNSLRDIIEESSGSSDDGYFRIYSNTKDRSTSLMTKKQQDRDKRNQKKSLVDKERGLNLRNIFNGHTGNIKFTNLNFQDLFMIIIIAVDLKTVLYLIKKENNKAITKNKK